MLIEVTEAGHDDKMGRELDESASDVLDEAKLQNFRPAFCKPSCC